MIVFFNGGPGASSSPLHIDGFGPRVRGPRGGDGRRGFFDNPTTLLDVADLLFVDPVGTEYCLPLRTGGGVRYWSPQGDADATLSILQAWLRDEERMAAPVYLAGESYGGYRLAMMAPGLANLDIAGLVLLSPALDFRPDDDQAAIDRLPTMAITAWHHRSARRSQAATDPRSPGDVWEDARRFAQGDYATALQQGNTLLPDDRARIAVHLAALTGLPVERIAAADLRVGTQAFLVI